MSIIDVAPIAQAILRTFEHNDRYTVVCLVLTSKEFKKAVPEFQRLYPEDTTWQYVSFLAILRMEEETPAAFEKKTITLERQVARKGSTTKWNEYQTSKDLSLFMWLPLDVIEPGASEETMKATDFVTFFPREAKIISDAVHEATCDRDNFNEGSAKYCLEFSYLMLGQ